MAIDNQTRRVRAAIAGYEKDIQKAILEAIQTDRVDIRALIDALETGNIERAVELLKLDDAALFQVSESIRGAYIGGGQMVVAPQAIAGSFAFNGRHWRAEEWIRQHVGSLIQGIEDETEQTTRRVILDAVQRGVGSRKTALEITGRLVGNKRVGGYLGLTSEMTDNVISARAMLSDPERMREYFIKDRKTGKWKPRYKLSDRRFDAKIKKAIREGRALTSTEVDAIIDAHKAKALGYRGRLIAKNESHNATSAGRHEAYQQMLDRPDVEAVTKKWVHGLSAEARPNHVAINGTRVDFAEKFDLGNGIFALYPHDENLPASETLNCRCTAFYRVKTKI